MDITKAGIYIIENNYNNKLYIGSTKRPICERFGEHKRKLKNNKHSSYFLQEDVNLYGIDNFTFKVLENIENISEIRKIESQWIKTVKPEYNIKNVITNQIDYTPELRKKMSISQGGRSFEVYNLDNAYIGTFDTQRECSRVLNIKQSNIYRCLKGETNSIKGYRFKYIGEDFKYVKSNYVPKFPKDVNKGRGHTEKQKTKWKESIKNFHKNNPNCFKRNEEYCIKIARKAFNAKVEVYKENKLVGIYFSIKEIVLDLKINREYIYKCLSKTKKINTYKGYTFIKKEL